MHSWQSTVFLSPTQLPEAWTEQFQSQGDGSVGRALFCASVRTRVQIPTLHKNPRMVQHGESITPVPGGGGMQISVAAACQICVTAELQVQRETLNQQCSRPASLH